MGNDLPNPRNSVWGGVFFLPPFFPGLGVPLCRLSFSLDVAPFLVVPTRSKSPPLLVPSLFQACERILLTPFPYTYVIHLRCFILLWVCAMNFVLIGKGLAWLTVPHTIAIAYALMGLEQLASQMVCLRAVSPRTSRI